MIAFIVFDPTLLVDWHYVLGEIYVRNLYISAKIPTYNLHFSRKNVGMHPMYNWEKMSISGVATLMENYILRKIGAIEKANDTEEEEGTRS